MKPVTYEIRDVRTKKSIGTVATYELGFAHCIRLYRESGMRLSYYVSAVAS